MTLALFRFPAVPVSDGACQILDPLKETGQNTNISFLDKRSPTNLTNAFLTNEQHGPKEIIVLDHNDADDEDVTIVEPIPNRKSVLDDVIVISSDGLCVRSGMRERPCKLFNSRR
jgi:hypothetical protein